MPPGKLIRVLCVHGVGRGSEEPVSEEAWSDALWQGLERVDPEARLEVRFLHYVDIFAGHELTALDCVKAVGKLSASWVTTTVGDLFGARGAPRGDLKDDLRWTAGMVVQWVEDERLRRATRARLAAAIAALDPDAVFAHSLGSLIAYDTFRHAATRGSAEGRTFVSLGSQIGNRAVARSFGGRIEALENARFWRHLFNAEDACFTARLRVSAPNFAQVDTRFDIDGMMDHDAVEYLKHRAVSSAVWAPLRAAVDGPGARGTQAPAPMRRFARPGSQPVREPNRRALLVGIDNYPDPALRLEGCVNDAYAVSALLQERGFGLDAAQPFSRGDDEIRLLVDRRATAGAIRERLAWLLEETRPGDVRFLYYSGHGAQIPGYGASDSIDRLDECLVPYDFDWSRERAILDDQIYELYSQLDYGVRLVMAFDCCHSGGLSRDGGPRVRGLSPPDDVRHRILRWNPDDQTWDERKLAPEVSAGAFGTAQRAASFAGDQGAVRRLGRAYELRSLERRDYDRARADYEHRGPYLPILFQACAEGERAFEHREGTRSGGVFTTTFLDLARRSGGRIALGKIADDIGRRCERLGYDQHPATLYPQPLADTPLVDLFRPPAPAPVRSRSGRARRRGSRRSARST